MALFGVNFGNGSLFDYGPGWGMQTVDSYVGNFKCSAWHEGLPDILRLLNAGGSDANFEYTVTRQEDCSGWLSKVKYSGASCLEAEFFTDASGATDETDSHMKAVQENCKLSCGLCEAGTTCFDTPDWKGYTIGRVEPLYPEELMRRLFFGDPQGPPPPTGFPRVHVACLGKGEYGDDDLRRGPAEIFGGKRVDWKQDGVDYSFPSHKTWAERNTAQQLGPYSGTWTKYFPYFNWPRETHGWPDFTSDINDATCTESKVFSRKKDNSGECELSETWQELDIFGCTCIAYTEVVDDAACSGLTTTSVTKAQCEAVVPKLKAMFDQPSIPVENQAMGILLKVNTVLSGESFADTACKRDTCPLPSGVLGIASDSPLLSFGSMNGDPHLTGFRGQKFDLIGKAGKQYLILADDRFQIGVAIDKPFFQHSSDIAAAAEKQHAPLFITDVHIAVLDGEGHVHSVSVQGDFNSTLHANNRSCKYSGNTTCLRGLQVVLDGHEPISHVADFDLGNDLALQIRNIGCPFNQRHACNSDLAWKGYAMATVTSPSIRLEVGAQWFNNHEVNHRTLHHLDLDLFAYRPAGVPRGLLGETVELRHDEAGLPIMKGPAVLGKEEDSFIIDKVHPSQLRDVAHAPQEAPLSASANDVDSNSRRLLMDHYFYGFECCDYSSDNVPCGNDPTTSNCVEYYKYNCGPCPDAKGNGAVVKGFPVAALCFAMVLFFAPPVLGVDAS